MPFRVRVERNSSFRGTNDEGLEKQVSLETKAATSALSVTSPPASGFSPRSRCRTNVRLREKDRRALEEEEEKVNRTRHRPHTHKLG